MTHSAEATSIRHQVTVDAPIERAFAVFTEDFGASNRASTTCLP